MTFHLCNFLGSSKKVDKSNQFLNLLSSFSSLICPRHPDKFLKIHINAFLLHLKLTLHTEEFCNKTRTAHCSEVNTSGKPQPLQDCLPPRLFGLFGLLLKVISKQWDMKIIF